MALTGGLRGSAGYVPSWTIACNSNPTVNEILDTIDENFDTEVEAFLGFGTANQVLATNATLDGYEWVTTAQNWGDIGGTLSDQTDLQSALDDKLENITGLVDDGLNVTITGTGVSGDPYVISSPTSGNINPLQVSITTAAATATKVGTTVGGAYVPTAGDILLLNFTNSNTASVPTLNIDGSGNKTIRLGGTVITDVPLQGNTVLVWYDGTYYQLFGSQRLLDDNSTYSEISELSITDVASSFTGLITGRRAEYLLDSESAKARNLTNKRIIPRLLSAASGSTLSPTSGYDIYEFTALAAGLTINAPSGTFFTGDKAMFIIKDNGTSRSLTWNATYVPIGVTLPTATTINKVHYIGAQYNATRTRWEVLAVSVEA